MISENSAQVTWNHTVPFPNAIAKHFIIMYFINGSENGETVSSQFCSQSKFPLKFFNLNVLRLTFALNPISHPTRISIYSLGNRISSSFTIIKPVATKVGDLTGYSFLSVCLLSHEILLSHILPFFERHCPSHS